MTLRRLAVLWTLLSAMLVEGNLSAANPNPRTPQDSETDVATTLLVQSAMQQGRECLARREYGAAVRVLEAQLPKINGNSAYLGLLEEAYRGYVKELQQRGQEEQANRYLKKLAILDEGVTVATVVRPAPLDKPPPLTNDKLIASPESAGSILGAKEGPAAVREAVPDALTAADRQFEARRYREAARLYEQAHQQDVKLPAGCRERWAYCKLHWVTEQINGASSTGADWTALEREVRTALSLAPRLEFGQTLLQNIAELSKKVAPTPKARIEVKHLSQKQNGWQVAESANFRVFHADPAFAEQAARVAEQTRTEVMGKWLGEAAPTPWSIKCEIYLHANGQAYSKATGAPAESPGHSSIGAEKRDASRISSRRIDLHVDDPNLLRAVLPHETTHATLAGQYGPRPLPRWADEGLAVLSEPADKLQRHLRPLPQLLQEGRTMKVDQLLQMEEYPEPRYLGAFYGQSASLVQYLSELRGPRAFTEFVRDSQRQGYEAALQKHYEIRGFADLQQRWQQYLATGIKEGPSTAVGNPR